MSMSVWAWLGAGVLLALAASQLFQVLKKRWARAPRSSREKAESLGWKLIDSSSQAVRPKPDCERPETLGVCTGRECLLYDSCHFAIKKPLP